MSTYLSHLDPSVRRCGMLVAEEVANRMGKKLDFGDWDGKGQGREWCAEMRRLASEPQPHTISSGDDVDSDDLDEAGAVEAKPKDEPTLSPEPSKPISAQLNPVLYDSDDSITGYASHHSSRSSSPSPSELLEIEKDPSLAVGRKKIQKPVYLMQLGDLLVHTARGEDQLAPMKEEMALKEGETLIRRKKGYGLELGRLYRSLVYFLNLCSRVLQMRTPSTLPLISFGCKTTLILVNLTRSAKLY